MRRGLLIVALCGCNGSAPTPPRPVTVEAKPPAPTKPPPAKPHGCPFYSGPMASAVFPDCPEPQMFSDEAVCPQQRCPRPCKITWTLSEEDELTRDLVLTYDAAGRLTMVTSHRPYTPSPDEVSTWSYDADGRVANFTQPTFGKFEIVRDADHRITQISSNELPASARTWRFSYGADGEVRQLTTPDGPVELVYDAQHRLIDEREGRFSNTYRYDASGRLVERHINAREVFGYDARGRLASTRTPDNYDDRTTTFTYDDQDRLVATRSASAAKGTIQATSAMKLVYDCR